MLIIIEGLDGTGKSTLSTRLRDEHGFEIIHKGPPTSPPLWEYTSDLFDYSPGEGRHVVCDRWHLGEAVYPVTRGRPSVMGAPEFETIESFLTAKGAILVYTLASNEVMRANLTRRGEPFNHSQVEMERIMFERTLARTTLPRVNVCLDRTLYERSRSLTPILEAAEDQEDFACR